MRSRNIQQVFILFTALLIVILGSGAAFAQGKGHDKGGGGENHGGGEKHGGGEMRGGGNPNRGQEQRFERPQFPQREQSQEQRAEQRWERPQTQREEQRVTPGWQKQEQRQQAWRVEQQRRPEVRQVPDNRVFEQWRNTVEPDRGNREARKERRYEDNQRVGQRQAPWINDAPRDYGQFRNFGQYRSNEVHSRNADRKAWKDAEKALRFDRRDGRLYGYRTDQYYRDNDYYRGDQYYRGNGYDYQYPQQNRTTVLRNLIASVLGSGTRYNNNYYAQEQPVYYTNQYYPMNYGGGYYNTFPQYQSYAIAPTYNNYQPYGYDHTPQYGDSYNSGYGDNGLFPSYSSSLFGGGIVQQIFSNLLALGYEQGYTRGLQAKRAGYGDRYYYDPYDNGDAGYIPYSNTLGENRRCLSDGYELGYQDALYNQRESFGFDTNDSYENTNVDLVSILIGSALQSFSS